MQSWCFVKTEQHKRAHCVRVINVHVPESRRKPFIVQIYKEYSFIHSFAEFILMLVTSTDL